MKYNNNNFTSFARKNFKDCLKNGDTSSDKFNSCFERTDFTSPYLSTVKKLLEKIWIKFDEDDLDVQEKFYNILDKIMDGIGFLRYNDSKKELRMTNVNQINDTVIEAFKKIDSLDEDFYLKNLTSALVLIVEDSSCAKYFYERLKILYSEYKKENKLPYEVSIDFYNEILNKRQNNFVSSEKKKMIDNLCTKLSYAKRKEDSIVTSIKIRRLDSLLKKHKYDVLRTSEEEIRNNLKGFATYLSSLKELRREGIIVSNSQGEKLTQLFLDGDLTSEEIDNLFPEASKKVKRIILNKYMQAKLPYLEKIEYEFSDLLSCDLGYNYNNYKIVSKENYYENLTLIFNAISEELGLELIESLEEYEFIANLPFFIDYFPELTVERVLSIIRNFPKIIKNMVQEEIITTVSLDEVMGKFYKLLSYGEAYENADFVNIAILGENIVERIIKSDSITSNNPNYYGRVYSQMLQKDCSFIPVVSGSTDEYYYESAHNADYERLLIGKNCRGSCVGIDGAGEEAYFAALTDPHADVIMFKSKYTNEFLGRCLCFRKGNYVVLAPIYGKTGLADNLYTSELLDDISSQMLSQATKANDTLEYVFSVSISFINKEYPIVEDDNLREVFPHADLSYSAYLIGSVKKEEDVNIDYNMPMPVSYDTLRDNIKVNEEVSNFDLNRIRALDILMIESSDLRNYEKNNFSLTDKEKYDEIYMGQDWFVAIKDGKIVDKVILPINDKRQENELLVLYKHLQELGIINDAANEMVNNFSSIRH